MPVSARKLAANRANARKSTGPRSIAAKEKVSQNRTVHGLAGKFQVLDYESQEEFDHFLSQLIEDQQPVGLAEVELVKKLAEHTWLSKRALRMQEACFSTEPTTPEQKKNGQQAIGIRSDLDVYLRYHAAQDRAYRRASQDLLQRRDQRLKEARGFESQKRAEASEARKEASEARKQSAEARSTERHTQTLAAAKARRQQEEIKAAKALADILPPDFAANSPDVPFPAGFFNDWGPQAGS
jgi:hypothetical protein